MTTLNLDPQATEQRARQLLDARIASVRSLVTARQRLADLRDQVLGAERDDARAYSAALKDGWSADELRALGLTEPEKKRAARGRRPSRAATSSPGAGGDSAGEGERSSH